VTAPARPKVRADLAVVEIDGEIIVYDERDGDLHHLNSAAAVVFQLLDGTSTAVELAASIAEAFEVRADEVESQVRTVIRRFRSAGLLDERVKASQRV